MFSIRPETPADITQIRQVTLDAFRQVGEANLVDALRTNGTALFSLVATQAERVVGHIMVSPVTIVDGDETWTAVAIAPVAVTPQLQKMGVGSQLVPAALDACRKAGHPLVFLLGHPSYYPRFGFVPAQPHGIKLPFEVSVAAFMVIELQAGALQNKRGMLHYAPEFDSL
ncbi:MAG: GNAT family N-acetyltransferase [Candidatus Promineifilaceae bacterium]